MLKNTTSFISSLSIPFLPIFKQIKLDEAEKSAMLIAMHNGRILADKAGQLPTMAIYPALIPKTPLIRIGQFSDGSYVYAVEIENTFPTSWVLTAPRLLCQIVQRNDIICALMRSVQLIHFQQQHQFCHQCGHKVYLDIQSASTVCSYCGLQVFTPINPAILALIEKEDCILLAHNIRFPDELYSLVAGYCEVGEPAENTVMREIYEEVGLLVHNVRFMMSQSWAYSHSLMLGFRCQWQSGEIVCDNKEIIDAHWYRADHLPLIPQKDSLARRMIDQWLAEQKAPSPESSLSAYII